MSFTIISAKLLRKRVYY